MFAGRKRLARIDRHLDRGDELMASIRDEMRLTRDEMRLSREMHERNYALMLREHELNRREHRETRAAVQSLRGTVRALAVQVEENTRVLRDVSDGIRAQTEGLMRVLDQMRGQGPGGEPATS